MFHSPYPSCQGESLTQCTADLLLYTHILPLRKRIHREGWSTSRPQSRKLMSVHPFISAEYLRMVQNSTEVVCSQNMLIGWGWKIRFSYLWKKKCCKDEKMTIKFLLWITARGPVLKGLRAVAYLYVLKTASCIMVSLITSPKGTWFPGLK